MGEFSVLGPIDPQILGLPAASIVRARDSKPVADVSDLTLVLADVGEKAVAQVKQGAVELLTPRLDQSAAETIAEKLTGGLPQSATPLSVPKDAAEQFLR
jgi:hypothetical protein